MRGWVILLETAFSIILLTAAYLYLTNNIIFQKRYNVNIYPEYFRDLANTCINNYIYMIYNLTSDRIRVCINGEEGTIEDLKRYTLVTTYIFSGKDGYDPFILYLYS